MHPISEGSDASDNDNTLRREVEAWTALLDAAKTHEDVAEVISMLRALGPSGARLREAVLAPVLARAAAEGLIEATTKRDVNGQRIYRSLIS